MGITTNNNNMRTTLILVAVTLAFAVCAEEMIDEPAADLYEQQSELYDSLLQKPATKKPATTSSRAAKIKEVDAKVAELNKQYASKKNAKVQRKAKVLHKKVHAKVQKKAKATQTKAQETFFLQLSKKEKRAAKIKEVDAKVAELNKQYDSKKHTKVQRKAKVVHKKVHAKMLAKMQKKAKAAATFFLQLSEKEKRSAKIKEVDAKVVKLNKQYASRKHNKVQRKAKVVHKKVHTKVQKMNTHVQKPHAKVQQYARKKQVDAKVVQLNKQYASRKHTKVHKLAKAEMSLYQQQSEMFQEMLE